MINDAKVAELKKVALQLRRDVVEMAGVQDCFGLSARSYDGILEKYGLTAASIVDAVKGSLRCKF